MRSAGQLRLTPINSKREVAQDKYLAGASFQPKEESEFTASLPDKTSSSID
jgi:hypothetical protein